MAEALDGKVALVTGGGSGIGQASALALARAGARVVVSDIDVDGGKATIGAIESAGGHAIFVKADVSQRIDVEAMINRTIEEYGQLDCAFNNAGIEGQVGVSISGSSEDDWDQVVDINLKGVWLCM